MAALLGLTVGLAWQMLAVELRGATPAEGFIAYTGGFIIGMLIAIDVKRK
jgi:hypothetical protein